MDSSWKLPHKNSANIVKQSQLGNRHIAAHLWDVQHTIHLYGMGMKFHMLHYTQQKGLSHVSHQVDAARAPSQTAMENTKGLQILELMEVSSN